MEQGQAVWFEIPVKDLDRAINFYSKVLRISIEKRRFIDKEHGLFNLEKNNIKGVLIEKENFIPANGICLFFFVQDILNSLAAVPEYAGEIILEKTLIKQKTEEGNLTIRENLNN